MQTQEEIKAEEYRKRIADSILFYADNHGMWPTIDFIVKRWMDKNPEYFYQVTSAILSEKNDLHTEYGEGREKGGINIRRTCEVPGKIYDLIHILYAVEKQQYNGGEKQFWRDFAKRYPVFQLGKS